MKEIKGEDGQKAFSDIQEQIKRADVLAANGTELSAPHIAQKVGINSNTMQTFTDAIEDVTRMVTEADKYSAKGSTQYREAKKLYEQALYAYHKICNFKGDPNSPATPPDHNDYFNLGVIHFKIARAWMGLTAYMRIDSKRIPQPDIERQYDFAIRNLKAAMDADPDKSNLNFYHYVIGTICFARNELDKAVESLRKSLELNGGVNSLSARWRLAQTYEAKYYSAETKNRHLLHNLMKQAIEQLEVVKKFQQDDPDVFIKLGQYYTAIREFATAKANLETAKTLCNQAENEDVLKEVDILLKKIDLQTNSISAKDRAKDADEAAKNNVMPRRPDEITPIISLDAVEARIGFKQKQQSSDLEEFNAKLKKLKEKEGAQPIQTPSLG